MRLRLLPVLGLLALAACAPKEPEQKVEFRVPVTVRTVEKGTVEDRIGATGTLRALTGVTLRAASGGVLKVADGPGGHKLAEGDTVVKGQTIAEIIGEEVRLTARSDMTRQRYDLARRDYDSQKKLLDKGLISEQEFHRSEIELSDATLEMERSRFTEDRSRLITPISGVILHLARDERNQLLADGQLVVPNFEVAQVAPTDRLVAEVHLVGPDVSRVRVDQKVRVRYHAWEGETFAGRVKRLAPSLDPMTRTLGADVEIDNVKNLLRPGMFVEATIIAERRENVPVVPREAVTERGGRSVVFVLDGQRVNRREVVLGFGDDEVVEIRQGLEAGERIVIRGLETLTDGTRVRVAGS